MRIDIAACAIIDYYAVNFPNEAKAMPTIVEFLQVIPYSSWCHTIAERIDVESFDTPEDRQMLYDSVIHLLRDDVHAGLCILNGAVDYCVRRGELVLPAHGRLMPSAICNGRSLYVSQLGPV